MRRTGLRARSPISPASRWRRPLNTALRERKGAALRVAVIGLGSGTLACASEPGETWKFFEIDQSMVDTAKDPKYFTYIRKCEPEMKPVIGDARLTFAKRA